MPSTTPLEHGERGGLKGRTSDRPYCGCVDYVVVLSHRATIKEEKSCPFKKLKTMRLSNILVAAGVISISAASQISLSTPFGSDYPSKCTSDDAEICSPIEDLRSLPSTEFTTLLHPDLPDYSVRIKQNGGAWCDETVRWLYESFHP